MRSIDCSIDFDREIAVTFHIPQTETEIAELVRQIERVMGKRVQKLGRPAGLDRFVFRADLGDTRIIVSHRKDDANTAQERLVLNALKGRGARIPDILHVDGNLTFQSDLGQQRLTLALYRANPKERVELLCRALHALGTIQKAASQAVAPDCLRPIGADRTWVRHFARGPERNAKKYNLARPQMPVDKLEALLTPNAPLQMIKWDSRAANGVIDEQGQVGWIDFEHSGLRGGYEDFAWLLADETMPILYQTCYSDIVAVLEENARHVPAHAREHFVKRIEVFATLQASVRLRVIKNEVDMKSWTSQEEILSDDVVGADPFMGERVAENAAFLAARNEETEPTVDLFVQTAQMFRDARKGGDLEELRL